MKSNFYSKNQRICSIVLTIALCLGMFAVSAVPAMAEGSVDPWELSGLHQDKELDFEALKVGDEFTGLSTNVASGEPVTIAQDEGVDNKYLNIPSGKTAYFDAHSDIETLSLDIKMEGKVSPSICYHYDHYTGDDGETTYEPIASMDFPYDTTLNRYSFRSKVLDLDRNKSFIAGSDFNWSTQWATIELTYGTAFRTSDTNRDDTLCTASKGNNTHNRYLTKIRFIDKATGETLLEHNVSGEYQQYLCSYGVNKNIRADGIGADTIQFGLSAHRYNAAFVDNIKVTYRNTQKVIDLIDAIGEVAYNAESLEKIEKAEAGYSVLTDAQKEAVTNYETLEAAREQYDFLVENPDLNAVIEKISEIGTVDASDDCLAKIVAAEEAYKALTPEKQALVENYADLVAARNQYNELKYGVHLDKELDFEALKVGDEFTGLSTIVASGNPITIAQDEGVDNKYLNIPSGKTAYFDAHSDIETLSFDIRLRKNGTPIPSPSNYLQIIYHRDKYTVGGTDYIPEAKMTLQYDSTNDNWYFNIQGAFSSPSKDGKVTTEDDWVTIKFVYGTEFGSSTNSGRMDNLCGAASETYNYNNRYLTQILVTELDGTVLRDYAPTSTSSYSWQSYRVAYGVNKNIKEDGIGADTIQFGVRNGRADTQIDNIKVTYRNDEAVSEVAAATATFDEIQAARSISSDDFTEENVAMLEKAAGVCELLPSATADYSEKLDELTKLYQNVDKKPVVLGATIKVVENAEDQMLRFNIKAPELSDDANIKEYGAAMLPTQLLQDGEKLTLETEDMLKASLEANELPDEWNSHVYKIPTQPGISGLDYCGVRITARPYVKYSVGENYDYIAYGDSTERSVNSVAKTIFDTVVNTETYSEELFGEIIPTEGVPEILQPGTYPANLNVTLAFLVENKPRIEAIAASQPR